MQAGRLCVVLTFLGWLAPVVAQDTSDRLSGLHRDIAYRTDVELPDGQADRCQLDVYVPRTRPTPLLWVWFHGGGLTQGRKEIPERLRNKGIIIVAANYRLSPGVRAPAYIEDAAAAVAWTIQNCARYGGNPKQVFVSGHSAGGYLAAMIGLDSAG